MSLCLNKKVEKELRSLPGNNICCDCSDKNPQWASVPFGIFMCLECSGRHRALGVHISFVRSVTMDSWSDKQIQSMKVGGNDKCNQFLQRYGIAKDTQIAKKYNSPAAAFYRRIIAAEADGLPAPVPPQSFEDGPGDVSDPIQRELKAREEARERMRQKFGGSAGLTSSGGVMQGIGSDANYRPGDNSASYSGGSLPVDVDQLAEASQKALSFLSSSLSVFGEQVVKTTQKLLDETAVPNNASAGSRVNAQVANDRQYEQHSNEGDQWTNTWSLLTSGAANIWKSAADATTEIVGSIVPPDDEDQDQFRFPRPPTESSSGRKQQQAQPRQNQTISSTNSWDSLSDILKEPTGSTSNSEAMPPSRLPPSMKKNGSKESDLNRHSPSVSPTSPIYQSPAPKKISPVSSATPTGEDFFANFGL